MHVNFTHTTHVDDDCDLQNCELPTNLRISGGNIYSGNVMKIHSVSKEDRGTYYCFADNDVGKGDRRNVNLEVW
jgi:hypothetical protein